MLNSTARPAEPIDAVPVIREVDGQLIQLLRELPEASWHRKATGRWTVRDVAAHLLDGNLRRLSACRDGMTQPSESAPQGFGTVVTRLNELNAEWIRAARRLSPHVITDLLETSNVEVTDYFSSLSPLQPAPFGVTWAGDDESPAWLDIAREFTEKWHHQQQIRSAVAAPGLTEAAYVVPLLKTLMFGVRHAYRNAQASDGASIRVTVSDVAQLAWLLSYRHNEWELLEITGEVPARASIDIAAEPLWNLLFRDAPSEEVRLQAACSGPAELVDPFFSAVAVMV